MALQFQCGTCAQDIIVRFLRTGEPAQCRHCGAHTGVPESAKMVDDEVAIYYQSRGRRSSQCQFQQPSADMPQEDRTNNPSILLRWVLKVLFAFSLAIGALLLPKGIALLLVGGSSLKAVGAVVVYVACGLAWFAHNKKMPMMEQIMAPAAGIILFWPFGLFVRLKRLKDPARFRIIEDGLSRETVRMFSAWNEALAFAKQRAAYSGHRVSILDHARYKRTIIGSYMHRIYLVEPSGEVSIPPF
jgi:hypothetical protein